jgi:hypothetical protein
MTLQFKFIHDFYMIQIIPLIVFSPNREFCGD